MIGTSPSSSSSSSSSPAETSSSSVVFNSQSSSSCETTPRSSAELNVKVNRINTSICDLKSINVASKIKKLEEKAQMSNNTNKDHVNEKSHKILTTSTTNHANNNTAIATTPNTQSSQVSSTTSSFSSNHSSTQTPIKYIQSPKFLQLYQKQMEVASITSYRKLEDIMNEADHGNEVMSSPTSSAYFKAIGDHVQQPAMTENGAALKQASSTDFEKEEKEKKKQLKSILRKVLAQLKIIYRTYSFKKMYFQFSSENLVARNSTFQKYTTQSIRFSKTKNYFWNLNNQFFGRLINNKRFHLK